MSTNRAPRYSADESKVPNLTLEVNPIDPEQSTTSSLMQSLKAHPKRLLAASSTLLLGSTVTSIYFLIEKLAGFQHILDQYYKQYLDQKVGADEWCTNWAFIPPLDSDKAIYINPCASLQEGLQNNIPTICSNILTKACDEYNNEFSAPNMVHIVGSVTLIAATLLSLIALYNACQKKEHTLLIEEVKEPLNPKPAQGVIKQEAAKQSEATVEIANTPVEPESLEQNYFRLTN